MAKKSVLPKATIVRIAKESGVKRVEGFEEGRIFNGFRYVKTIRYC